MIDNENPAPDFDATPPPVPTIPDNPPDFSVLATPKKRGRPKNPKPIPNSTPDSIQQASTYIDINKAGNIDITDNSLVKDIAVNEKDIKIIDKLTSQELTFLDLYFNTPRNTDKREITINKAMISAGYDNMTDRNRYLVARRIFQKYERGAGDAAKVFQDLGFGQIRVAEGIIGKTESKHDTVGLNALALAAKCLRMTEEKGDTRAGINIIINTASPQGPLPAGPGPANVLIYGQEDQEDTSLLPKKALQISR